MHTLGQFFRFGFLPAFLCAMPLYSLAATPKKKEPIHITADEMVLEQLSQKAVAEKNVVIVKGQSTLYADRVEAYFTKQGSTQKIHMLKAFGHVKIQDPSNTATGDTGTYDINKEEIILEGNVTVSDDNNQVKGAYGIMNQKTGVTRVLNHKPGATPTKKTRVSALLVSDE